MLIRIGYNIALRLASPTTVLGVVFGQHLLESFSVITEEINPCAI